MVNAASARLHNHHSSVQTSWVLASPACNVAPARHADGLNHVTAAEELNLVQEGLRNTVKGLGLRACFFVRAFELPELLML